jgi:hypothetical protein
MAAASPAASLGAINAVVFRPSPARDEIRLPWENWVMGRNSSGEVKRIT